MPDRKYRIEKNMTQLFNFKEREIQIRQLVQPRDFSIINKFCVQNSDFFIFQSGINGHLVAAEEILTELPPGKKLIDKSVWGAFEQDQLIAVIEGMANYPKNGIWYLGLYIIDDGMKKSGFSIDYYHYFENSLLPDKVESIRIAVLAGNHIALKFWAKNGFIEIERKEKTFSHNTHQVIVMEKAI